MNKTPSQLHGARWHFGLVAFGLMTMLALSATPACAAGPGWTAPSTVSKLVITSNGGVNILLSPGLTGCVSQSGYGESFASVYPSHPGIKMIKADLLAAYLTDKKVSLYLGDSSCTVVEMILGGW